MVTQLHLCQQSIHGLSHLAPDTIHLGPGLYSSQWTLERTIGNLGEEIKQPLNPYVNLAICGLCHSQILALHAILPNLEPDISGLPQGAVNLSDGYVLLRAQDETGIILEEVYANAIQAFLVLDSGRGGVPLDWQPKYIRWARLRLPNLQVARCAWKEMMRNSSAKRVRLSCNVKVRDSDCLILK